MLHILTQNKKSQEPASVLNLQIYIVFCGVKDFMLVFYSLFFIYSPLFGFWSLWPDRWRDTRDPGFAESIENPLIQNWTLLTLPVVFLKVFFFFFWCATTFNYEMSNILISVSLVKPAYQMQCSVNYLGTNCPLHIVKIVDLVASLTFPEDRWLIIMKLTILIIF